MVSRKKRSAATTAVLAVGILLLALASAGEAQVCSIPQPLGPFVIYDNALLPGWGVFTDRVTPDQHGTPGGQEGTYALQLQFTGTWGNIEFHRDNMDTHFLSSLVFRIRKETSGGDIQVTAHLSPSGLGNWVSVLPYLTPSTSSFAAGQWYKASIPLSVLGVSPNSSIQGILFQSSTVSNVYLDSVGVVSALLTFPLSGFTPYTAQVSTILDHSVDATQLNFGYYKRDGTIRAYDGFSITSTPTTSCTGNCVCLNPPSCSIAGYMQDSAGTPFDAPGSPPYTNMRLLNYADLDGSHGSAPANTRNILWYDGHPGYDYPRPAGTPILAATSGTLCVASNRTTQDVVNLWRNPSQCPYGVDAISGPTGGDSWDGWHMFYIIYNNNFSSPTFSTWYLHAQDLAASVKDAVKQNGYATVQNAGDTVALVGHTAPAGVTLGDHLHFEVRYNQNQLVDPYGDGSVGHFLLLWKDRPQ